MAAPLLRPTHEPVSVESVRKQLTKVKVGKAVGPDDILLRVLNICADQLFHFLHTLFFMSLTMCKEPAIWKTFCVVPVLKKINVSCLNDLRSVALTSHVMKVLERLVLNVLKDQPAAFQDPSQFTYRTKIGVDEALLYMLHSVYYHLEKLSSFVRIMGFFYFSSAFNTIQPHLLDQKLQKMFVHHPSSVS